MVRENRRAVEVEHGKGFITGGELVDGFRRNSEKTSFSQFIFLPAEISLPGTRKNVIQLLTLFMKTWLFNLPRGHVYDISGKLFTSFPG